MTCYMALSFIRCQKKWFSADKIGILQERDVKGLFGSQTGSFWSAADFYLVCFRETHYFLLFYKQIASYKTVNHRTIVLCCSVVQCVLQLLQMLQ